MSSLVPRPKGLYLRSAVFCCLMLCTSLARAQEQVSCPSPAPAPPASSLDGLVLANPVPAGTTCYSGPLDPRSNQPTPDANGAYYLIAIPANWNGTLFLFSHGGPNPASQGPAPLGVSDLGAPDVLLPQGYAIAATSFSRNGWAVSTNALDIESLRQIFVKKFRKPRLTLLFGGSYSGGVLERVVERYGVNADGTKNYDGAAIGCGLLGGLCRYFDAWLDQRVVYEYYCKNYPRSGEAEYPLYFGMPLGINNVEGQDPMDVAARVQECTGIGLPPNQRTAEQQQNLANIQRVLRIPEEQIGAFATNLVLPAGQGLRDFTQDALGGSNAISNADVIYKGSTDDEALNRGVARYEAEPAALHWVNKDSAPTGNIQIPVLTFHTVSDQIVFVETESVFHDLVESRKELGNLVQLFVKEKSTDFYVGHCQFTPSEFAATFDLIVKWVESGAKPTPADANAACQKHLAGSTDPHDACRFDPNYRPKAWSSRVYPRNPDPDGR